MNEFRKYAVVTTDEARKIPYPYVFVNGDRTVRELHAEERAYLEHPLKPTDGARPYVKDVMSSIDGWGRPDYFLLRSELPAGALISDAPFENPNRPLSKAQYIASLKGRLSEFEVRQAPDGTVVFKRK